VKIPNKERNAYITLAKSKNKKIFVSTLFFLVFSVSYACSRGNDGKLFLGLAIHLLFCFGIIFKSIQARLGIKEIAFYSLLYLVSAFVGVWVGSELDEMAGMLFVFFPSFSILYFITASTINYFRGKA